LKGNCDGAAGAQASSGTGGSGGASSNGAGSGGKNAEGAGAIRGQVTDMKGAPILGAAVHVLDLPPVVTDESGVFAIGDLEQVRVAFDTLERRAMTLQVPFFTRRHGGQTRRARRIFGSECDKSEPNAL